MFRKIISTIVAVAFVLPATVQAAVLTAADSKCSDRYENTTRVNPTELSDYQRCIIDEVWSGENYGTIGTFVWLRVNDDVVAVTKSDIQRHGKAAVELAIVDSIVAQETALLEEAIAELDQVLTEIQNLEEALTELGFTPEEVEAAVTKKYEELMANLESDHAKALVAQAEGFEETIANQLEEITLLTATINDLQATRDQLQAQVNDLQAQVTSLEGQLAELQIDYDNKEYTVTVNGVDHVISADTTFTIDVEHQVSVNINGYEMDTHAFTADGDFNLTVAVNSDGLITVDGLHTINGVEAAFGKVDLEDGVHQSHVDAVQTQLDAVQTQLDTANADLTDVRDALTVETGNLADAVDAIMNGNQDFQQYENAWNAVNAAFGDDVFYGDWIENGGGANYGESLMNSLRKAENDSNLILVAGIIIKSLETDLKTINNTAYATEQAAYEAGSNDTSAVILGAFNTALGTNYSMDDAKSIEDLIAEVKAKGSAAAWTDVNNYIQGLETDQPYGVIDSVAQLQEFITWYYGQGYAAGVASVDITTDNAAAIAAAVTSAKAAVDTLNADSVTDIESLIEAAGDLYGNHDTPAVNWADDYDGVAAVYDHSEGKFYVFDGDVLIGTYSSPVLAQNAAYEAAGDSTDFRIVMDNGDVQDASDLTMIDVDAGVNYGIVIDSGSPEGNVESFVQGGVTYSHGVQLGTNGFLRIGDVKIGDTTILTSKSYQVNNDLVQSISDMIDDVVEAAYDQGYDDGYNDGYADGYADGFEDGVNSVQ